MKPLIPVEPEDVHSNTNATEKKLGGITGKGFMPGQSGNPAGRVKKRIISEIYEELLEDPEFREQAKKAIRDMVKSGRMVGQLQLKEMTDRTEGKVTQPIEADLTVSLAEAIAEARKRAGR